MRLMKFVITLLFTLALLFLLNNPIDRGGNSVPPIAKILNPFTGFWQNAETAHITLDKSIDLPGLKEDAFSVFSFKV